MPEDFLQVVYVVFMSYLPPLVADVGHLAQLRCKLIVSQLLYRLFHFLIISRIVEHSFKETVHFKKRPRNWVSRM